MRKRLHLLPNGRTVHLAGWKPQAPDHRDFKIEAPDLDAAAKLPATMLAMREPVKTALGVYDQGQIGSCTANGSLAAFRWLYWKAGKPAPQFSRLAQYAWTRDLEGTPLSEDSGCSIRDAIKTMHVVGCAPEELWQYDTFMYDLEPPAAAKAAAVQHETSSYHSVAGLLGLKQQNRNWYPVVFGFPVHPGMMTEACAKTGEIPIPAEGEEPIGGHCMIAFGYCDQRRAVLCLNSWGEGWGDGGFAWLPYAYFDKGLASDLWVVHTAEGVTLP